MFHKIGLAVDHLSSVKLHTIQVLNLDCPDYPQPFYYPKDQAWSELFNITVFSLADALTMKKEN